MENVIVIIFYVGKFRMNVVNLKLRLICRYYFESKVINELNTHK